MVADSQKPSTRSASSRFKMRQGLQIWPDKSTELMLEDHSSEEVMDGVVIEQESRNKFYD